jgi:hypothetical protein
MSWVMERPASNICTWTSYRRAGGLFAADAPKAELPFRVEPISTGLRPIRYGRHRTRRDSSRRAGP